MYLLYVFQAFSDVPLSAIVAPERHKLRGDVSEAVPARLRNALHRTLTRSLPNHRTVFLPPALAQGVASFIFLLRTQDSFTASREGIIAIMAAVENRLHRVLKVSHCTMFLGLLKGTKCCGPCLVTAIWLGACIFVLQRKQ